MEMNFQKLQRLIKSSALPQAGQDDLIVLFALAPDEELSDIAKMSMENPKWLAEISKNLAAKREALRSKNLAAWQDIIRNEETLLQSI